MTIDETIRELRRNGELLGPLIEKYGAPAVVSALGSPHIACSLGLNDFEPSDCDEGW